MNRTVLLSDLTFHSYGSRTPSAPAKEASPHLLMAQPPLLIQEGNSESRFVCMNARTTKCQNWRRHADTIAHKSEKMANLQAAVYYRRFYGILRGKTGGSKTPVNMENQLGPRQ